MAASKANEIGSVSSTPDSFKRIFFGETSEDAFAGQLRGIRAAQLTPRAGIAGLDVHATVDAEPVAALRLSDNHVRAGIRKRYAAVCGAAGGEDPSLDADTARMYAFMREYCDVFHAACTPDVQPMLERIVLMHVLNHISRTEQIVHRENTRRKTARENGDEESNQSIRDSSLTRAKALIIVPMRNSAFRCVQTLLALLDMDHLPLFRGRFTEEFGEHDDGEARRRASHQPSDFQDTFRGNTDDNFMVKNDLCSLSPVVVIELNGGFADWDKNYSQERQIICQTAGV